MLCVFLHVGISMDIIDCKMVVAQDRVTIPVGVRKRLNLKRGDFISFSYNESGQIVIEKVVTEGVPT